MHMLDRPPRSRGWESRAYKGASRSYQTACNPMHGDLYGCALPQCYLSSWQHSPQPEAQSYQLHGHSSPMPVFKSAAQRAAQSHPPASTSTLASPHTQHLDMNEPTWQATTTRHAQHEIGVQACSPSPCSVPIIPAYLQPLPADMGLGWPEAKPAAAELLSESRSHLIVPPGQPCCLQGSGFAI